MPWQRSERRKLSSQEKGKVSGPPRTISPGPGGHSAGARNAVVRLGGWFARESSRTWSIRWMKWALLLAGMGGAAMLVGVLSGLPLASQGEHTVKLSDAPLLQTLVAALVCAGFLSFLLGMPVLLVVLNYSVLGLVDRHRGELELAFGGWLVLYGCMLTFVAVFLGIWLVHREKMT